MKNLFLSMIVCFTVSSCAQKKEPVLGDTDFQRQLNSDFKDASSSPLLAKDLKVFKGLDFFKFDEKFIVKAELELTPDTPFIEMPTTTDRLSIERVYGILHFELNGKKQQLNVYQNKDLMLVEGFEDYLFLPFIDNTNGETTYGGGRYLDMKITKSLTIDLDFNKAYNPYCAYNYKYSCPVVPLENSLDVKVEAGVKTFKPH